MTRELRSRTGPSDRGSPSLIQAQRRENMVDGEEDELEDIECDDGELSDGNGELEADD